MKWYLPSFLLCASIFAFGNLEAQVAINATNTAADGSAMLDVTATGKGILIPRMTYAERPSTPVNGLLIYQTDNTPGFYYYNGSWVLLSTSANTVTNVTATTPLLSSGGTTPDITLGTVPIANGGTGVTSLSSGIVKSNGTILSGANTVTLTSEVTGTLPIGNGGTGQTSFGSGFIKSNGTILSGGNSVALESDVTGVLPVANGGTQWTGTSSLYFNGGVGIGTTTTSDPSAILELKSNNKGLLLPRMSSTQIGNMSTPVAGLLVYQTDDTPGVYYHDGSTWTQLTSPTTSGTVTSVTAGSPLSVTNTATTPYLTLSQATNTTDGYLTSTDWNTFNGKVSSQWTNTASNIYFTSGKVGIGLNDLTGSNAVLQVTSSNSPVARFSTSSTSANVLDIAGTSTGSLLTTVNGGNGRAINASVTGSAPAVVISNNGTGIGLYLQGSNSKDAMQIYNDTTFIHFYSSSSVAKGKIMSNGQLYTVSDARLKENILNTHLTLDDIMKIKVRDYNWKSDGSKKLNSGFIAQELYEVYPNAVSKPAKPEDTWMVTKDELIPLIVKSIQDQQNIIVTQKAEIDSLKLQMIQQQKQLDAIKAKLGI